MDINELKRLSDIINNYQDKILLGTLSEEERIFLTKELKFLEHITDLYEGYMYQLGRFIDYDDLLKKGFTKEEISNFQKEDAEYLSRCREKILANHQYRNYMLGYPANMIEPSSLVKYLKYLETKLYYMNNCGDPKEVGNYMMDNKEIELAIISLFKNNLGLKEYEGYITTGGTEGNIQGINLGFSKYPNGILYYSSDAHYSINKANYRNKLMIKTINGHIDTENLLMKIVHNYRTQRIPAILFLTFGTTKKGAVDDIYLIKKVLNELKIPHYIHVDAALYGGIPIKQNNAPKLAFSKLDIDSISVSLHKYLGINRTNGVLLTKKSIKDNYIDYIGQNDTTLSGSRDFLPLSTYQQVKEVFERTDNNEYCDNIIYFENLLQANNIYYEKGCELGNIFVINKPSEEICNKYQLATFKENDTLYAHIIIHPFHKKDVLLELVNDLKKTKVLTK